MSLCDSCRFMPSQHFFSIYKDEAWPCPKCGSVNSAAVEYPSTVKMPFEDEVERRHQTVRRIVAKHLELMHAEITAFDELTLNVEGAGDVAEVAHQALTILVEQLRGFSRGARSELAERRAEWDGEIDKTEDVRKYAG